MNTEILNNNTGATYFLNEKEKKNFFIKNKVQNYNEINLTRAKANKNT